jgi:hypothetical protein
MLELRNHDEYRHHTDVYDGDVTVFSDGPWKLPPSQWWSRGRAACELEVTIACQMFAVKTIEWIPLRRCSRKQSTSPNRSSQELTICSGLFIQNKISPH